MNLFVIFLTGLTVGGLSCLAVQGGLLASVIAVREEENTGENNRSKNRTIIVPTLSFLVSKLIAHIILGFILGAFGGVIKINQTTQVIMQFAAGLYMLAVALNLLEVHPIFRYVVIQPPRFLTRKVRNASRSKDFFAPALLGALTIFIPCGTTLAMEALAISSANAFIGASIMGVFVLGTTPLFFGIGWITSLLGEAMRTRFLKIAAVAVLYLGMSSLYGALVASGFSFNLISPTNNSQMKSAPVSQSVTIEINSNGYSPSYIKAKKDSPLTITLVSKNAYSCASAFRIPALGIAKNLLPSETYTFTITPTKVGKLTFTCSMGMYTGIIDVI